MVRVLVKNSPRPRGGRWRGNPPPPPLPPPHNSTLVCDGRGPGEWDGAAPPGTTEEGRALAALRLERTLGASTRPQASPHPQETWGLRTPDPPGGHWTALRSPWTPWGPYGWDSGPDSDTSWASLGPRGALGPRDQGPGPGTRDQGPVTRGQGPGPAGGGRAGGRSRQL